ncbi:Alkaline phosphatase-like alpha/beta/alpha [Penicillium fimorum]|uniref:Alkaline phosphatase-like alpha/beta/alpha n=1 Tax=Penicillium fimorum TaxID=1882269 RepID=A0A9W9XX65_9EURO|nr:Alkaline phosphatase-like alpha/beta/alpha [Penicillium fimorum]
MGCGQVRGRESAGNEVDIEWTGAYGGHDNSDLGGFLAYGSGDLESHDPLAMLPPRTRRRQDFGHVARPLGSEKSSVE